MNIVLGFISLHKMLARDDALSKERKIDLTQSHVEFSDDYISNGVEKVTENPGIMSNTDKYSLLLEYASVLAANVK